MTCDDHGSSSLKSTPTTLKSETHTSSETSLGGELGKQNEENWEAAARSQAGDGNNTGIQSGRIPMIAGSIASSGLTLQAK